MVMETGKAKGPESGMWLDSSEPGCGACELSEELLHRAGIGWERFLASMEEPSDA